MEKKDEVPIRKTMEKNELEDSVVSKVAEVISAINNANQVDQVISSLHSIATLLFPINPNLLSGSIDESYREQLFTVKVPSSKERDDWWHVFYHGPAFSTLARFLLLDVASNWLACFPFSAQKYVYDVFFVHGFVTEVLQILVPFLQQNRSDDLDINVVISNSERLLVLCLLENNGVLQIAREFGGLSTSKGFTDERMKPDISRMAQIVVSIPDKARMNSPTSLSSYVFFRQIIVQVLSLEEDREVILLEKIDTSDEMDKNGALLFIGEMFSRICRRGSADLLSSELVPGVLRLINSCLSSSKSSITEEVLESKPETMFWLRMMESIRDPYTTERISEQILHKLASQQANDVQAYWVLWLLFHRIFRLQASVRSMFVDKFLLWKVFPVSCLKWILQFAVCECPPSTSLPGQNRPGLLKTVQRLLATWSKKEFVQTAPIEQQACILFHHAGILKNMWELKDILEFLDVSLKGLHSARDIHHHCGMWGWVKHSNVCSLTAMPWFIRATPFLFDVHCCTMTITISHAFLPPLSIRHIDAIFFTHDTYYFPIFMSDITAALGLSLETMSKEELDGMKEATHLILQGISGRLESPNHLVRKMASNIALAFSMIIDPKNPLYLDDSCNGETIDWTFGFTDLKKGTLTASSSRKKGVDETDISTISVSEREYDSLPNKEKGISLKGKKKLLDFNVLDPDEIVDPASLNLESDINDEDDGDDSASENSYSSSDSSLQPYDLSDDDSDLKRKLSQLSDVVAALRKSDDADGVERALDVVEKLIRASPDELKHAARDLTRTLVQVRCCDIALEGEEESTEDKRQRALIALAVTCPFESLDTLHNLLYSPNVDISQRIMILDVMTEAAQELAESKITKLKHKTSSLVSVVSDTRPWFLPSSTGTPGAGSWKEISGTGTFLNWSNSYERELPSKPYQVKKGKTRRWSLRSPSSEQNLMECSHNKFPMYAAAFMLPAMEGYDKKRHGVDLLGRDFIVLGKLIYMLGVCMKSAAMHPEASVLAPSLLDMLRSREVCRHQEAYVRKAVLFAAACVLVALHPAYVSSALLEGNVELSNGLEWIRTWALDVADSDTDKECYSMAMTCLQLHAEMALQTSRALESARSSFRASPTLRSDASKMTVKIPYLNGS